MPKGSCAAKVKLPLAEEDVVIKSLLKKYLNLESSDESINVLICLSPVGNTRVALAFSIAGFCKTTEALLTSLVRVLSR